MKRAGFTLAETVVALALFSAAAVVFCQAALNARMALRRPDDDAQYQAHVHTIQNEVLRLTDRNAVEAGGEMSLPLRVRKAQLDAGVAAPERVVARWTATVLPTPLLDLHQITLTITFLQAEVTAEAHERVFNVYRPNWYDPDDRDTLRVAKQQEWDRNRENQP
ncbi:MAG TPA: hypothetical protein DCS43_02445 [Verrucomicrobia bacterium]|nr:hypothetical protein [Verrucomicrobiota bacterium]